MGGVRPQVSSQAWKQRAVWPKSIPKAPLSLSFLVCEIEAQCAVWMGRLQKVGGKQSSYAHITNNMTSKQGHFDVSVIIFKVVTPISHGCVINLSRLSLNTYAQALSPARVRTHTHTHHKIQLQHPEVLGTQFKKHWSISKKQDNSKSKFYHNVQPMYSGRRLRKVKKYKGN